jgi:hypothetical protein
MRRVDQEIQRQQKELSEPRGSSKQDADSNLRKSGERNELLKQSLLGKDSRDGDTQAPPLSINSTNFDTTQPRGSTHGTKGAVRAKRLVSGSGSPRSRSKQASGRA